MKLQIGCIVVRYGHADVARPRGLAQYWWR
jgi:hypothetical protein